MRANEVAELRTSELAILELIRTSPVSYFPPRYLEVAERLAELGLLRRDGDVWFPTRSGLAHLGVTLH